VLAREQRAGEKWGPPRRFPLAYYKKRLKKCGRRKIKKEGEETMGSGRQRQVRQGCKRMKRKTNKIRHLKTQTGKRISFFNSI